MHDVILLLIKGLAGGTLVVTFALLAEGLSPKRFAGLFSAAPAVALAGLTVTLVDQGWTEAHKNALGMLAGSGGMVVYAAVVIPLLRRIRAWQAAAVSLGAWAVVAGALAIPVVT